jgi:hypothetical protein
MSGEVSEFLEFSLTFRIEMLLLYVPNIIRFNIGLSKNKLIACCK